MKTNNQMNLHFVHANGFLPGAYDSLLSNFDSNYIIKNYLLLELFKRKPHLKLKNWIPFYNDFMTSINTKNNIAIGHSIGGNIVLRTSIENPDLFKSIILLDPTLFVPKIIFFWKIFNFLRIQNKIHPWLTRTLNRKMEYSSLDEIFKSYRKKHVFSRIDDKNLKIYIDSLTIKNRGKYIINYSKKHEYLIYKTGLFADNYIWKNLEKITTPTLIIRAEHSNAFLKDSEIKVSQKNSQIKIITIKNTSHLFPLEEADKTFEHIKFFLNSRTNN